MDTSTIFNVLWLTLQESTLSSIHPLLYSALLCHAPLELCPSVCMSQASPPSSCEFSGVWSLGSTHRTLEDWLEERAGRFSHHPDMAPVS